VDVNSTVENRRLSRCLQSDHVRG